MAKRLLETVLTGVLLVLSLLGWCFGCWHLAGNSKHLVGSGGILYECYVGQCYSNYGQRLGTRPQGYWLPGLGMTGGITINIKMYTFKIKIKTREHDVRFHT